MHTRKTDRKREITPWGDGHATISSPFSSQDLEHTHTRALSEFKPPGLGLESQSTTWESSVIAITLTAGPQLTLLEKQVTVGEIITRMLSMGVELRINILFISCFTLQFVGSLEKS